MADSPRQMPFTFDFEDRLTRVLRTMDVPERRRILSNANIRWLLRNLRINNADHPDLEEVIELLRDQLRQDVLSFNIFDHRS